MWLSQKTIKSLVQNPSFSPGGLNSQAYRMGIFLSSDSRKALVCVLMVEQAQNSQTNSFVAAVISRVQAVCDIAGNTN